MNSKRTPGRIGHRRMDASSLTDRLSERPRYALIQKALEDRIVQGVYPAGSLIPTEVELATEFNSSRFTVREALRYLREHGYVERRQGVGTRVLSRNPQTRFVQTFTSLAELFQVALETWFVILEINKVVLETDVAEAIGALAGEEWFKVDGVRWTEPGGKPICYIQSYIPARFEELIPKLDGYQGPFFSLLESHSDSKIENVTQEISAVTMPPQMSRQLGLVPGVVSLRLLRRYLTDAGVLIASFNWHPGDQMTYVMNVQRAGSAPE